MKKIKKTNQGDRVICITRPNTHCFYYQPCRTNEKLYLFSTKKFSYSIFNLFRSRGIACDDGYSLTLREIHSFRKMSGNYVLEKFFSRLPGAIDYAIKERDEEYEDEYYFELRYDYIA